jgi:hypothetical protein
MVIILRGCSGSGKSTHAAAELESAKEGRTVVRVSADDFFTDSNGVYNFDVTKLGEAHAACLREFVANVHVRFVDDEAVDDTSRLGSPVTIVVDNTNTTGTEVAPYAALATAYGHELKILTIVVDPEVAHARNLHGVPLKTVKDQYKRLQNSIGKFPPWWPEVVIHG